MIRRILYIALFGLIFWLCSWMLHFNGMEAMPIGVFGCCLGWAVAEFKRETRKQRKEQEKQE